MAEIVKLAKIGHSGNRAAQEKPKPLNVPKPPTDHVWPSFTTQTVSMPLVAELMRDTLPPRSQRLNAVLESGVLAFRREGSGEPLVLLISKRRSKKWGIPKG